MGTPGSAPSPRQARARSPAQLLPHRCSLGHPTALPGTRILLEASRRAAITPLSRDRETGAEGKEADQKALENTTTPAASSDPPPTPRLGYLLLKENEWRISYTKL